MELRHLRYFKVLAEQLNFTRAAEQLHVGQPALSRQIQDLEDELGTRLLDRSHTQVQLTDAGRTYYSHVCKILALVDMASASVQQTIGGEGGELILCSDWRISNQLVLRAISDFRARYPQVEVTLRELKVHEQLTALRTRKAHLGFLTARELPASAELQSLPLFTFRMKVAVSARHRLAAAPNVRLADLANEEWLITGEHPGLREYIAQVCRLSGFVPGFGKPSNTLETILARVATGQGITFVPEFLIATAAASPLVHYLDPDCPPIEVRAVWHIREESKLLHQFVAMLRQHIDAQLVATDFAQAASLGGPRRKRTARVQPTVPEKP